MSTFENPNAYEESLQKYSQRLSNIIDSTKKKYNIELEAKLKKHKTIVGSNLKDIYLSIFEEFRVKSKTGYYADSTFRTYRACLIYGLALKLRDLELGLISDHDIDLGFDEYFLDGLYKDILAVEYIANSNKPKRTSELKAKYFEKTFFNYILRDFQAKTDREIKIGDYDQLLVAFVEANLIVGLRPVEWFSVAFCSAINGPKNILIVQNGKATHGRANGYYRYLILDNLKNEELEKIFLYWNLLNRFVKKYLKQKEQGGPLTWEDMQLIIKVLGERLRLKYEEFCSLRKKILDDTDLRPTLYSTRHQCIANAKSKDIDKFIIAGTFGHASKDTAAKHYGRKWRGDFSFNIYPTMDTIERVNGSYDFVKTLLAKTQETPYYFELNIEKDFNTDYYDHKLKSGLVID